MTRQRWLVLAMLMLAVLVAFSPPPRSEGDLVLPVSRAVDPGRRSLAEMGDSVDGPSGTLEWQLQDRQRMYALGESKGRPKDLFASIRANSPQPPPAPPLLSARAPEFPLAFAGKQRSDGQWEVFFVKDNLTLIHKEGDVIDQVFQLVKVAPPTLTVIHLPTSHRYAIAIGDPD